MFEFPLRVNHLKNRGSKDIFDILLAVIRTKRLFVFTVENKGILKILFVSITSKTCSQVNSQIRYSYRDNDS